MLHNVYSRMRELQWKPELSEFVKGWKKGKYDMDSAYQCYENLMYWIYINNFKIFYLLNKRSGDEMTTAQENLIQFVGNLIYIRLMSILIYIKNIKGLFYIFLVSVRYTDHSSTIYLDNGKFVFFVNYFIWNNAQYTINNKWQEWWQTFHFWKTDIKKKLLFKFILILLI